MLNDGMAGIVDSDHTLEDFLVCVKVEIVLPDDLQDIGNDEVFAEHAAKNAALRITALRGEPFPAGILARHGGTSLS